MKYLINGITEKKMCQQKTQHSGVLLGSKGQSVWVSVAVTA